MYETEIPVLGIATRFIASSAHVLTVVEEAFGSWRLLDGSALDGGSPQTVRVIVREDGADDGACSDDVAHLLPGDGRLMIHARGAIGVSDPARGEAVAWVSPELLQDRDRFRYGVLEALTWALLTRCDRQPLHAAAVVRDGTGLLLCGPSGAGKSTLAYAAARAGMHVLSEDMVFVQSQPRLRVWGAAGSFHLLPAAAAQFDELGAAVPVRLHNGKRKVVVAGGSQVAVAAERVIDSCGVCVLGEHRPVPECRRLTSAEAVGLLDLAGDPGFDVFAHSIAPALERLAQTGAWLLHPSPSPDASVPLLAQMLAASAHDPIRSTFSQP